MPEALVEASRQGFPIDLSDTTFFLGIETLLVTDRPGMPLWRERTKSLPSPDAATVVRVVGEQFNWNIHYPGADGRFGDDRGRVPSAPAARA